MNDVYVDYDDGIWGIPISIAFILLIIEIYLTYKWKLYPRMAWGWFILILMTPLIFIFNFVTAMYLAVGIDSLTK